ncbi:ABC transporter ATP-binding protein [Veronia nyctiphanis]|uniref:ABC transporter ATP-binding protein n=1 Tax=Veronia nyctiphanis TaxID=1278244 RepID=UPI0011E4DFEB
MTIEFTNFSFRYDSQVNPTLKNINLTIQQGEKVLIVGPSGSGKSTLGQCLNGLIPHVIKGEAKGSLSINGKNTASMTMHNVTAMVGTVLQDTDSQFVGLSIGEDIAFALENRMMSLRCTRWLSRQQNG